jgi:colanic acid/amylovoran biosynthesis protein
MPNRIYSKNPTKIIISHVYSADNKGDAALLGVLITEIKNQFPGSKVTILTMDALSKDEEFDGVKMRHSFMYYVNKWSVHKLLWLAYGTFMMFYTLFAAWLLNRKINLPSPKDWQEVISLYAKADLVIAVGGGYMRTKPGIGSIYDFTLLLHPLVLSKILGTPSVLYTQSVGPLHRNIERTMLAHVFRKDVETVIVREDKSMKLLEKLGVHNIIRSVDAGFLLKTDKRDKRGVDLNLPVKKVIIGVTARHWLKASEQREYERAMAETLDYLIKKHDAFIVFIPQVTSEFHGDDDRIACQDIFERMSEKQSAIVLTESYNYRQIKTIYDRLDLLLGTRFHSVIFSLTSYVPALAVEYEHKTSGIMRDLGLEEWVVKMEDATPEILCKKMDKLIVESAEYKEHLREVLPSYVAQAHDAIGYVANAYQSVVDRVR